MFLDVSDDFLGLVEAFGQLDFAQERITVRELIHERVRQEMQRVETQRKAGSATINLTVTERRLNTSPARAARAEADASRKPRPAYKAQCETAERAFAANEYFILLDDRQATDLDEPIYLGVTRRATFLLLTPLKGG